MSKERIPTDGGQAIGLNAFAGLSGAGLPQAAPKAQEPGKPKPEEPRKNRGRVEIRRTTAGRGGKTVTLINGFVGIGLPEKEVLAKQIQKACGSGGTVKDGAIEIQGDRRNEAVRVLEAAGFRPVLAGG